MDDAFVLETVLAFARAELSALASSWLEAGATAFGLWSREQELAVWPAGASLARCDLSAPIKSGSALLGELRLLGLSTAAARARLEAEAALLARLAHAEGELEIMTEQLIENRDQLLALYDLAKATRSLDLHQTMQSLAEETARLFRTGGAFAMLAPKTGAVVLAEHPHPVLDDETLKALFQAAREGERAMLFGHGERDEALPEGIDNLCLAPIQVQGEITAMLGVFNKPVGKFTSPDIKLARAIAEWAGSRIENVLLHQESIKQARLQTEMELAWGVQARLLPQAPPCVPGLDVFGASRPALQVGGDFYDFITLPGLPFMFDVGDVSGKGLSAALIMTMTRTTIRSSARAEVMLTPAAIVSRANSDLYDDFTEVGSFVTVFVGRYDPAARKLCYANAGHSPVVYCPVGGPARLLEADGTPLGILPTSLSEDQELLLRPGDVLIVATDGFSETRNPAGELFGYERLLKMAETLADRTAEDIAHYLFSTMENFSSGRPQDDDQTLIVVKGAE